MIGCFPAVSKNQRNPGEAACGHALVSIASPATDVQNSDVQNSAWIRDQFHMIRTDPKNGAHVYICRCSLPSACFTSDVSICRIPLLAYTISSRFSLVV